MVCVCDSSQSNESRMDDRVSWDGVWHSVVNGRICMPCETWGNVNEFELVESRCRSISTSPHRTSYWKSHTHACVLPAFLFLRIHEPNEFTEHLIFFLFVAGDCSAPKINSVGFLLFLFILRMEIVSASTTFVCDFVSTPVASSSAWARLGWCFPIENPVNEHCQHWEITDLIWTFIA